MPTGSPHARGTLIGEIVCSSDPSTGSARSEAFATSSVATASPARRLGLHLYRRGEGDEKIRKRSEVNA